MKHPTAGKTLEKRSKNLEGKPFHVKDLAAKEQSVQTFEPEDAAKVKSILKANEILFFSHTPRDQKNRLLVIKGLNNEYDESEVVEALKEIDPINAKDVKVKKLTYTAPKQYIVATAKSSVTPRIIADARI